MLFSLLLVLPDCLLVTCKSEEEVSCQVSIQPIPKCAIVISFSHQELSVAAQMVIEEQPVLGAETHLWAGKVGTAVHLLHLQSLTSLVLF